MMHLILNLFFRNDLCDWQNRTIHNLPKFFIDNTLKQIFLEKIPKELTVKLYDTTTSQDLLDKMSSEIKIDVTVEMILHLSIYSMIPFLLQVNFGETF